MKYTLIIIFGILFLIGISNCKEDEPIKQEPSVPSISIQDLEITESEDTLVLQFDVNLTGARDATVILDYETIDATAIAGEDYNEVSGQLTFPKGSDDITETITIKILGDYIHEETETFEIHFSTSSLTNLDKNTAIITIIDNDEEEPTYDGYITPTEYEDWTMVFADEFSGNELNGDNWTQVNGNGCPYVCGFGNNELQYYKAENSVVDNGLLTINVLEEDISINHYTSSRLKSHHKVFFKYGRLDIRAKLPYSKGLWPALWLMGENKDTVSWPSCGEIDLMELRGETPNKVSGVLHYKNSSGVHEDTGAENFILSEEEGDFSDEFHVFTIIWNPYKVTWYVDDEQYNNVFFTHLHLGGMPNPFLKEFFILMNVAVGGNYVQNPDDSTVWPQKMEVDYVRVFQKN